MIIAMQKTAPLWLLEDQIKSGRILGQIVAPKSPVVVVVLVCNLNGICGPGETQTKKKKTNSIDINGLE